MRDVLVSLLIMFSSWFYGQSLFVDDKNIFLDIVGEYSANVYYTTVDYTDKIGVVNKNDTIKIIGVANYKKPVSYGIINLKGKTGFILPAYLKNKKGFYLWKKDVLRKEKYREEAEEKVIKEEQKIAKRKDFIAKCHYSKNEIDEFTGVKKVYTIEYFLRLKAKELRRYQSYGDVLIKLEKDNQSKTIRFSLRGGGVRLCRFS